MKLEYGDVICTIQRAEGGFQGKVFVAAKVLEDRKGRIYLCPEIDRSRRAALHRAMAWVDSTFPPD